MEGRKQSREPQLRMPAKDAQGSRDTAPRNKLGERGTDMELRTNLSPCNLQAIVFTRAGQW